MLASSSSLSKVSAWCCGSVVEKSCPGCERQATAGSSATMRQTRLLDGRTGRIGITKLVLRNGSKNPSIDGVGKCLGR